ncbi:MAG: S8 family serine peptidase [Alphaproteobacteria bacterium]|nr:S8 family serine peptidase [Alphaproteobacteria bacterium]
MTSKVALALALIASPLVAVSAQTAAPAKKAVTSANDLPTYNYKLAAAPSELVAGPLEPVLKLADAVLADDAKTVAGYDIKDLATREGLIGRQISAALLRKDVARVKSLAAELRSIQERPDRKLTAGLMTEIVAESCVSANPQATASKLAAERLSKLPYDQLDTWMKQQRAGLSTANPDLLIGSLKQQLDPVVAANGGNVNQAIAASIVGAKAALQCNYQVAPQLAAALGAIIDKQAAAAPKTDIWAERQVTLTEGMKAKPVGVAIWDSGVDMSLFKQASDPVIAIDGDGKVMKDALLRPAGEYAAKAQQLMDLVKGSMDLQAGQMTAEATAFQATVRGLKPEQAKQFSEEMGFVGSYVHGTHVAGIATAGNPFARVQAVSMHWPVKQEELRLSREISERRAAFYKTAVARMKTSGVRVVNMSWRVSPAMFEGILQLQGGMPDAAARKKLAEELFAIEKAGLTEAIKSAPEILFVAGAGNEANDANFADYIPAGISAPNLLTVGAVDKAGREALFTSIGGAVAIYANGVEVESFFPGGQRRALSGTSMASPQVANTAAKLVAMKPEMTGAQLRELLVGTADTQGRVKLLNPKKAFQTAGIAL